MNSSSKLSTYEASTPKLYPPFVFTSELQVSAQFSDDFCDDLVRSSQQQVVSVEYERYSLRRVSPQASAKHVRDEAALPEALF